MMPEILFRLRDSEKGLLARHLAAAAAPGGAGLPRAVAMMRDSGFVSGTCERHLNVIERHLSAGLSLADALRELPGSFRASESALVEAGERAGRVDAALAAWGAHLRRRGELRRELVPALAYLLATAGAVFVFVTASLWKVVPTLATILVETGQEFSPALRVVVVMAQPRGWIAAVALALLAIALWRLARRSAAVARALARGLAAIPILGKLHLQAARWLMLDMLATHVAAGMAPADAMAGIAGAMSWRTDARDVEAASRALRAAEPLPRSRGGLFDARTARGIERALADTDPNAALRALAADASEACTRGTRRAASLTMVAFTLAAGLIVGFFVVAVGEWTLAGTSRLVP